MKHTDLYLYRSYSRIQITLNPDTILFLGDLFDGGREWATNTYQSPEKQYWKYGDKFWLREFDRFSNIFFREWGSGGVTSGEGFKKRKIGASLPGNHDLGFGGGIQLPVRDRFQAYFGESNRVDIIGNHTFISLDSVSLSAREAKDSATNEDIWHPTTNFLNNAQEEKAEAIIHYLEHLNNTQISTQNEHDVLDILDSTNSDLPPSPTTQHPTPDFPTILLTHVPLYRNAGFPCGPLRERYPPTSPPPGVDTPVTPDERNAIPLNADYQYQNVLDMSISRSLIDKLGGQVDYAFSGDDHDYCDVVHQGYPSRGKGIREITVKSISWAMGVRKPGFLLVSMWNPIDVNGKTLAGTQALVDRKTLQTHLCLLPDQLAIFILYGKLLCISAMLLLVRALLVVFFPGSFDNTAKSAASATNSPLLPVSKPLEHRDADAPYTSAPSPYDTGASSTASSSSDDSMNGSHLSNRDGSISVRSRAALPGYGYGSQPPQVEHGRPLIAYAGNFGRLRGKEDDGAEDVVERGRKRARKRGKLETVVREWGRGLWGVGWVVMLWYAYLWRC